MTTLNKINGILFSVSLIIYFNCPAQIISSDYPEINIISPVVGQQIIVDAGNPGSLTVRIEVKSKWPIRSVVVILDKDGDGKTEVELCIKNPVSNEIYDIQINDITGPLGSRPIYAMATNNKLIRSESQRYIELTESLTDKASITTYFEDILGIGEVMDIAFSPDGTKAIVGGGLPGEYGVALLYDVDEKRIIHKFFGHTDQITSVEYFPRDTIVEDSTELQPCLGVNLLVH